MNRRDNIEARARELAILAGVDPDSRTNKQGESSGGRGMPAWCGFRDAVRAERLAVETASVVLPEQAAQYRNSPLRVFGHHDDATLAQMRNCMSVGNAVAGVICADGHLGYAQPVGGVIAYEDQVSISGVGFDIGCFTGDTRISTLNEQDGLDDYTPTLAELEGQDVWILGNDIDGQLVPTQGRCLMTERNSPLVKVTLDNGNAIRCTPCQLFMLLNGTYVRADALNENQPLMPYCPKKDVNISVKVISVEVLEEREDVYCLQVPGMNNFPLADGVYVHNCGNMAVRLDTRYEDVAHRAQTMLSDIRKHVSFGVGRVNEERVDHALFDDADAWRDSGMEHYRQKARAQLGTVGSGNHYVDLFEGEDGHVWIGVHFGSRGLGHSTATKYLKIVGGKDGMNVLPSVLDVNTPLGESYLAGMELAGRYAHAGREWVVERVRRIIGGTVLDSVHNNHNYAEQEVHGGRNLWVVRKGATPAFPGQKGFVGGSMGDDAVILEGVQGADSAASLYSTVHGAGRICGRKEAKRRFTREAMDAWLAEKGVLVAGGDLDESPMSYRRLPDVLAEHAGTVRVLHRLRPFAVAMAGDEVDPFKD